MRRWFAQFAVGILPPQFRHRYRDELLLLLERSPSPCRDTIDVLHLAVRQHMEVPVIRPLHRLALATLAVTLVLFGYVINDLGSGVTELAHHWWSSAALAGLIVSGIAAVLTSPARRPNKDSLLPDR